MDRVLLAGPLPGRLAGWLAGRPAGYRQLPSSFSARLAGSRWRAKTFRLFVVYAVGLRGGLCGDLLARTSSLHVVAGAMPLLPHTHITWQL